MDKGKCKICGGEGEAWDAEHTGIMCEQRRDAGMAKFVIMPSGRIDYCCECDDYHGYYCPKIGA